MSGTGSNDPKSVQDTADIKEESKGDDEELDALLDGMLFKLTSNLPTME
jgi:hypothetical protein